MDAELRQELVVSTRGLDAWRLYRDGAPASLVLDMFPRQRVSVASAMHGDMPRSQAGIAEVLRMCRRTAEFGTVARVAKRIKREVKADGIMVSRVFERESFYLRELGFVMDAYGHGKTIDASHLFRLTTFLMRTEISDVDRYSQTYAAAMSRVWFAMCDTASRVGKS